MSVEDDQSEEEKEDGLKISHGTCLKINEVVRITED